MYTSPVSDKDRSPQSQQSPDDDGSQITTAGDDNDSDEGNNADRDTASVQTPACPSLAWSSSGNSFSTISRKHLAATTDSSEHPMKCTHGCKPTQSDAGFEMANAMRDLARSALGDAADHSILSPACKKHAIEHIEADYKLSDEEMISAFKLVHRETSVADTYIAISSVAHCTCFLQAELEAAAEVSFFCSVIFYIILLQYFVPVLSNSNS
ncbi:hypothetical protein BT96DRAFT_1003857 [Gymnopus androsaceus JB14]|uniref:Uncharacterized protein n=1 Tax=Gymnopus androsaceus JB14 TaxID=1447944 RepID=A0A6A4GTN4_9AGAR|nr:hypothetical protein BT96DRAFT_1003857 [Gymnopus androsaceus JB14]